MLLDKGFLVFNIMGSVRLEVLPQSGLTGEFRPWRSLAVTLK